MRIPKVCLKQSFSHSKWTFQSILSFQTVFLTVQSLTSFLYLTVSNYVVFFRLLDSKFNEDSKNVPKTVIF